MASVFASMRDWWRYQGRLANPAHQARHSGGESADLKPQLDARAPAHADLVSDPMGSLARATEQFAAWQVASGFDLLRAHHGIETASDAQNVMLALQQGAHVPAPMQPYTPLDQPWHAQPMNDPLASPGQSGAPVPGQ